MRVGETPITQPAAPVDETTPVAVDAAATRYVGRAGHKLAAALDGFGIDVVGKRALDVGASTGGFTDCLLERGAIEVVAVDVGRNQLHPELRADRRVVSHEATDIRSLDPTAAGGPFPVVVVDVSFISLQLLAPHLARFVAPGGDMVVLVKPQFEAGPGHHTKRGVVGDQAVRAASVGAVMAAFATAGMVAAGAADSPLTGAAGNRELLLWLQPANGAGDRGDMASGSPA